MLHISGIRVIRVHQEKDIPAGFLRRRADEGGTEPADRHGRGKESRYQQALRHGRRDEGRYLPVRRHRKRDKGRILPELLRRKKCMRRYLPKRFRQGKIRRRISCIKSSLVRKSLIFLTYLLAETYLEQADGRMRKIP